jgi:hypothetical protein
MFSFFDDSRQNLVSLLNSFDLIRCLNIISIKSNDVQYRDDLDAINLEVMIDSIIVCVAKDFQSDSDVDIQLIEVSFDSVFEIILNDFLKRIIFSIVEISLIEYVVDILVEKFVIRSNEIQFIFEESSRVEISAMVVLSDMKSFRKIIRR